MATGTRAAKSLGIGKKANVARDLPERFDEFFLGFLARCFSANATVFKGHVKDAEPVVGDVVLLDRSNKTSLSDAGLVGTTGEKATGKDHTKQNSKEGRGHCFSHHLASPIKTTPRTISATPLMRLGVSDSFRSNAPTTTPTIMPISRPGATYESGANVRANSTRM